MGIRIRNMDEWILTWPIGGTATGQIDCATTVEADADKYFERAPFDGVIESFTFQPSVAQVGGTSTALYLRVGTTAKTGTMTFTPSDVAGTPKKSQGNSSPIVLGDEIKLAATKVGTITTSLKGSVVVVIKRTRKDRP